jgi:Xaa-Pro aminopeptidase
MDLDRIQKEIRNAGADLWLLCDFHNRDVMACHILGLDPTKFTSRRWYYFIPSEGEPTRLVSQVEPTKLDRLPGKKETYRTWQELHARLKGILGGPKKVAMQYSPLNHIPYVSVVDAGTVELIRSFGHEVVSSANLVQAFEAVIDRDGYESHLRAGEKIQRIKDEAFALIGKSLRERKRLTEYDVQRFILSRFDEEGLDCKGENPIVGVNEHPADPHFEPTPENSHAIKRGDKVLIDLWAKEKAPGSIFYDITWCGFAGEKPPQKYVEIFDAVRAGRDAALAFIRDRFARAVPCFGWEVDDACRHVIERAGWGDYFVHRTGHSIGQEVHGNGVNIDNLETKDERELVPGICFSIEPGIYLEGEMAVRTEIDVFITLDKEVVVAGEMQKELIKIL